MEPIISYLEGAEKKLMTEMSELFNKMREQRNSSALQGIEDMYSSKPLENVLYDPCVRIPGYSGYYCSQYKLPKDEYVIMIKTTQSVTTQYQPAMVSSCIALTNYGRWFLTLPISENRVFGGHDYHSPVNDTHIHRATHGQPPNTILPIIKLEPLPYKIPDFIHKAIIQGGMTCPTYCTSKGTDMIQELNKEFYLFAGKWKPHMTECATLDVDTMRQTIIDNEHCIEELKGKEERIEQQNKNLQAELKQLKKEKATLEKEKAKLLPLEKYKDALLEFMDEHYTRNEHNERWLAHVEHDDNDKPIDTDIIRYFSDWHTNKVFMDEWEYDNVIASKEELNEYRIYKKVKGEMVSSGMDNSSVARNVRSIKNSVNKLKS